MEEKILVDLGKDNSGWDASRKLITMLPEIAKMVIVDRPENENFKSNPDDPNEHAVNWHQFGIITHTLHVLKSFQTETQEYLRRWGLSLKVNKKFQEQVDGILKFELFQISIILHDLGKFARNFEKGDGNTEYNFYGHEAMSEKLIVGNPFIYHLLNEALQLTTSQIYYIARCAGLHFELGKARDAARRTVQGYSIVFSNSDECLKTCNEIACNFPQFKEEVGVFFLCDCLAKTDIRINAETDVEIESQTKYIQNILQERKLNPKLIEAIKQLPVSIAIARRYLENV